MEQFPILDRFKWLIMGFVGVVVLAVFGMYLSAQTDPVEIVIQPPLPTGTHTASPEPTLTPTNAPLEVYVTGAVSNSESRHALPYGSRIEDAIAAAGGATEMADLSRVNLAGRLQDGDHIHVPAQNETLAEDDFLPTPNTPRLIDLNAAAQEELETLPGIGPSTAAAIITYREENGAFASVDELDNVPGIGATTLERLRPLVMIEPLDLPSLTADQTAEPEAESTPDLINLNTATQEELETLPGIGPSTAAAIITYREENGMFSTVDELDNVPGIGPAKITELRELVTVE